MYFVGVLNMKIVFKSVTNFEIAICRQLLDGFLA
jgi:hypothetical protein